MLFNEVQDKLKKYFGREVTKNEFTIMRILNYAIYSKHGIMNEGTISKDEEKRILEKWEAEGHLHFDNEHIVLNKKFAKFLETMCNESTE